MSHILKYVILRGHTEPSRELRFCAGGTEHQALAAPLARTHAPASAGYCELRADGTVATFGSSTSLCLTPAPGDDHFIGALLRANALTAPEPGHAIARP